MIVLVDFEAPHRVVAREAKGVELTQNILLEIALLRRQFDRFHRRLRDLAVPRVSAYGGDHDASCRVRGEEPRDQVFHGLADESRRTVIGGENFFVQGRGVLIFEGKVPTYQREEYDTTTPQIAKRRHVAVPCNHLGSRIAGRTASSL